MVISIEEKNSCVVAWHKGLTHKFYEDSFRLLSLDVPVVKKKDYGEVFGVFDGMGSAPQGRRAAQILSENLLLFFNDETEKYRQTEGLEELLFDTNLIINSWGKDEKNKPIGGAVGTVFKIWKEEIKVFHAGDTRAILFSEGTAKYLTSIHQAQDGAVTQFFGMGTNLRLEKIKHGISDGDRILLCSDGLTGVLGLEEISEIEATYLSIKEIASNLVERAIKRGSKDDITVLIYEVVF